MKWFQVTYKRNPNAKAKTVKVQADTSEIAHKATERMLRISGSPEVKILSVREFTSTKA
jgi:hypothetical protein